MYQLADKQKLKVERTLARRSPPEAGLPNGPLPFNRKRKQGDDAKIKPKKKTATNGPAAKRSRGQCHAGATKEKKTKVARAVKVAKRKVAKQKVAKVKVKRAKVDRSNPNWRLKPNPAITVWEKVSEEYRTFVLVVFSVQ